MKKLIAAALLLSTLYANAQIGIGTTSPNSTLDVRGSLATPITTFSTSITAGASDNLLIFSGTSPATLTLPTAVGITGREYWIKNVSSNSSTLTIATTSSQTIDGLSSWSLTQTNKVIRLVSNGTNWYAASESLPGNSAGTAWIYGGNAVGSQQNIGTTSNFSLPFITNNTEKMRLTSTGNLGIGTSTFSGTFPERFLVDAGATGNTNYQNVIVGKGNTNSYAQLNIQNSNSGTTASADVVATANNGTESVNFVDMGINSSGYSSSGVLGGANNAYLYSTGNDFVIGNAASGKDLILFTNGTTTTDEKMRITDNGNVGIGTSSPNYMLHLHETSSSSNWMQITNGATGTGSFDGFFYGVSSSGQPQIWGEGDLAVYTGSGTTNNLTMTMKANGSVGIGTTTINGTNPEHLIVDAGTNGSGAFQNVIVGKGNTNSYAQLNIQNGSTGTAASSDVVATANNGNESVNFIDMGINGGSNTSTGILGAANTAYIYSTGSDLAIGNGASAKDLIFFTGGLAAGNERLRATANGITVTGSQTVSYHSGTGAYTVAATDYVVINTGAAATWTLPAASGCAGRIYRLVNDGTGAITLTQAVTLSNANTSTNLSATAGSNSYEIISDGSVWRKIN